MKVDLAKDVKSLTGLRGIAAIYVVLHHFIGSGTFSNLQETFWTHGYLAVDLFFVLSGFVMALNYKHMFEKGFSISHYYQFMGRRIARVYPIYFITTIIAFLVIISNLNLHISASVSTPVIWGLKLVVNSLLIQSWGIAGSINDPAWSLSAEWAAYVVFPLLLIPTLFRRVEISLLFSIANATVLSLLFVFRLIFAQRHSAAVFDINDYHYAIPLLRCLPEFSLGIVAYRVSGTSWGHYIRHSSIISLLISIALVGLLFVPRSDLLVVLLFPLFVVTLSGGGEHIPGYLLSSSIAVVAGRLSYSIYLIHTLFGGVIHYIGDKVGAVGVLSGHSCGVICALVLTAASAELSYRYVEVPSRMWLRAAFGDESAKLAEAKTG